MARSTPCWRRSRLRAPPRARSSCCTGRARGGAAAREPAGRALLARLRGEGRLYAAPHGSNDDWYWLHAAVAARGGGLLVSNDEMRDHAFALLAPRFVGRWKERHQCRYDVGAGAAAARLDPPRPFSVCAQWVVADGAAAPAAAAAGDGVGADLGAGGAWVLPPAGERAWGGWVVAQVVDEA